MMKAWNIWLITPEGKRRFCGQVFYDRKPSARTLQVVGRQFPWMKGNMLVAVDPRLDQWHRPLKERQR
jgi:hypothetical protein